MGVGVFGPTANGDRFALFQIVDATLASTVIVALLIAATYDRLPWRRLPEAESAPDATSDDPALTRQTPKSAPLPGAYAESS
jgi:alpha-1,6-mannosyltransferase